MLPKGLLKEYSRVISFLVRALDMLTIFIAGWVAYALRFDDFLLPQAYFNGLIVAICMTPVIFSSLNIYASTRGESFAKHSFDLMQAVCLLGFVLAGLSFFTKSGVEYSRTWFALWLGLAAMMLLLCRWSIVLLLRLMRARGLNERRVVIFGTGELAIKITKTVQQALWTGYRIVKIIEDNPDTETLMVNDIPVMRTPDNLAKYLSENSIDEIWLALPLGEQARVKEVLYELRNHTITTRFVLDIFSLDLLNHSITDIAGFPVLNIRSTPMIGFNRLIKAIEDRLVALIILILISPLFVLIALLIKLTSKGPIFFKQHRLGWDGKIIKIYKFRTMFEHVEEKETVTQATINDKRVTALGRLLRRSSLDELPQFINVLQGRMSIVGPRPHALAHNELYKDMVPVYMQRHRVKPGITGWAQVNGWRGETDTLNKMQKRVEYDLYYINNWSFAFDLKIILLTVFRGFINRNAY